jgi:transcriptional regulator with XRE-family HTH domain
MPDVCFDALGHMLDVMRWSEYVERVIGSDRQVDVARRTGINQTTISRWLAPQTDHSRRTSQSVAAFARAYGRPVLEAFVVAGFLTPEEAGQTVQPLHDLSTYDTGELAAEVARRLTDDRPA